MKKCQFSQPQKANELILCNLAIQATEASKCVICDLWNIRVICTGTYENAKILSCKIP